MFYEQNVQNIGMNKFAKRLKELRITKNLSRAHLAEMLGTSVRTVSYWEEGKRECGFDMLITLAKMLDSTVDYLIGATEY